MSNESNEAEFLNRFQPQEYRPYFQTLIYFHHRFRSQDHILLRAHKPFQLKSRDLLRSLVHLSKHVKISATMPKFYRARLDFDLFRLREYKHFREQIFDRHLLTCIYRIQTRITQPTLIRFRLYCRRILYYQQE